MKSWNKTEINRYKGISCLVRMCTVCISNNINRNAYMYLNTWIFPTTGYARVLLFMFIRRELGGTGTGCLYQFTYCDKINVMITYTPKTNTRNHFYAKSNISSALQDRYHLIARIVTNEQSIMLSFKMRESGRVIELIRK